MPPRGFRPAGRFLLEDYVIRTCAFAAVLTVAFVQPQPPSSAERQRADMHYRAGWQALQAESFDESAREFTAAIELYPRFTLAYYGLGRAEMGAKKFADAVRAYEQCRTMYMRAAG